MRREIGSEFWDIPTGKQNNLLPETVQWFISGRSALRAIIAENSFKSAALPAWCCDSMIQPFADAGIEIVFYTDSIPEADAVLVMDFFGFTGTFTIGNFNGIVIRDVTHSLLSKAYDDADYYFGSLRKWAGFWTGGYAWGFKQSVVYEEDKTSYVSLRKRAMHEKMMYMLGETDSKGYLALFNEAEKQLDTVGVAPADARDVEQARIFDVEYIKQKRRSNAAVLLNAFKDIAIYPELTDTDCPMFVPIRVKNRDDLRRYLIEQEIYCPIHWPVSSLHCLDDDSEKLYNEELSLVCDQRYDLKDMNRMVSVINEFFDKGE